MKQLIISSSHRICRLVFTAAVMFVISSCGEGSAPQQASISGDAAKVAGDATVVTTRTAKNSEISQLPHTGKQVAATPPQLAAFGMIWHNSSNNKDYIFDGADWVPHDQSVEEYYQTKTKAAAKSVAMIQEEVCLDGDPACTPTGAHKKHEGYACTVCHKVGGRLVFDKTGPAYGTGAPAPTYDATAKTCTNVACHSIPAGTFSYYFPGDDLDGDGYPDPELKTVSYGGVSASKTPSWYSTGGSCKACHNYPNNSYGVFQWHTGIHGGTINACEYCHNSPTNVNSPIAQSVGGIPTAILIPSLHANGTVNVNARFKSTCFNCH